MRKLFGILLTVCFLSQNLVYSALGQPSAISLQSINLPTPALLRYVSVNQANPLNYFNFLLDAGNRLTSNVQRPMEDDEAKKLVNYFFLGLTIPEESLWVNLQPNQQDEMVSKELSNTDMGKVFLEQDLQLKKDMARYLHPKVYEGQLFWRKLNEKVTSHTPQVTSKEPATTFWDNIKSNFYKNTSDLRHVTSDSVDVPYRVWIVPDSATVVETEDGALVTEAKLKVMLEVEYLGAKSDQVSHTSQDTSLRSQEKDNQLNKQNQLNQPNVVNPYAQAINKSWTKGLESEYPWSKQNIWKEYQESYNKGEYQTQASLIGIGVRKFFSGGVLLGITSSVIVTADNMPKIGIPGISGISDMAASPVLRIVSSPASLASIDSKIRAESFESVSPLMLETSAVSGEEIKFSVSSSLLKTVKNVLTTGILATGMFFTPAISKAQEGVLATIQNDTNYTKEFSSRVKDEIEKLLRRNQQKIIDIKWIDEYQKMLVVSLGNGEFVSGEINTPTAINSITHINGIPTTIINERGRPGNYADSGFTDDIIQQLSTDNEIVRSLGVNHRQLADLLYMAVLKCGQDGKNKAEFEFNGMSYKIEHVSTHGFQPSIFNNKETAKIVSWNDHYVITNLTQNTKFTFAPSHIAEIGALGFYESREINGKRNEWALHPEWIYNFFLNKNYKAAAISNVESLEKVRHVKEGWESIRVYDMQQLNQEYPYINIKKDISYFSFPFPSSSGTGVILTDPPDKIEVRKYKDYILVLPMFFNPYDFQNDTDVDSLSRFSFEGVGIYKNGKLFLESFHSLNPQNNLVDAFKELEEKPSSLASELKYNSAAKEFEKRIGQLSQEDRLRIYLLAVLGNSNDYLKFLGDKKVRLEGFEYLIKNSDIDTIVISFSGVEGELLFIQQKDLIRHLFWENNKDAGASFRKLFKSENIKEGTALRIIRESKEEDIIFSRVDNVFYPNWLYGYDQKGQFKAFLIDEISVIPIPKLLEDKKRDQGSSEEENLPDKSKVDGPTSSPLIQTEIENKGGIDLSNIELAFKDDKFFSSPLMNPADRKVLLAAKALKQGFVSLSLLRVYEAIGFIEDKIVREIQNKELLTQILGQLKVKAGNLMDDQFLQFSSIKTRIKP